MAVSPVSPGSYNSPSVQPQTQAQRTQDKGKEAKPEEKNAPPLSSEHSAPTVNTSGQTIGRVVNTKA